MTQQLPARGEPGGPQPGAWPHVWTGQAWEPAPAGWVPPRGWLPTGTGWVPAPPGWEPPPDWVCTPSGYLPPYRGPAPTYGRAAPNLGAPDAGSRGFGWTRCLPGPLQRAAALADRRPSGWEILVVLAVFPAAAFGDAVASLAQTLTDYSDGATHSPQITPAHPVLGAVLLAVLALADLAPAALAVYLLKLSGGGVRAIGLDRRQPRTDLARCAKLVLYAYIPAFVLAGLLQSLTPHHDLIGADSSHLALVFLLPSLLQSVGAGVVEEIVVLGFLVHRLEQRGWDGWRLYAVCIAVRVSYHLYYGTGAIGLALWAGMSVFLYRRRRRLLTFVGAHIAWDSTVFVTQFLHGGVQAAAFAVEIAVLFGLWLTGRRPAVEEMTASGVAARQGRDTLPA